MKKINFWFASSLLVIFLFNSCQKSENVPSVTKSTNQSLQKSVASYKFGALLQSQDVYRQYRVATAPAMGTLPVVYKLPALEAGDQGVEGSCVAWATTYAARSIEQQRVNGGSFSQNTNIFSPEYVFNQIKIGDCENGSYVTDALDLLKNQGACRWSIMPYTDAGCSLLPNSGQTADASSFKISNWSTVPITVADIEAQLASGHPVVVAGPVSIDFINGVFFLEAFNGNSYGNHAYCIVGYKRVGSGGVFLYMNSWGSTWGPIQNGKGWMSYSYLSTWVKEAYVLY